tara:strand:- start:15 stop:728 length:714 start_codon:yes stop_codon:yes gene_type:complete
MNETNDITTLILAGDGYQLTISAEATARKEAMLVKSGSVTTVASNDDSAAAQFHTRSLAAMRIEVEKSRKLVKEPVNRIGKLIDATAADFMVEIVAEEGRIKQLIGDHAKEMLRIKAEKEAIERAAFDAARAAREAAEEGGIAAILAAKRAAAEKLQSSAEVASTKVADGVRFAWDFEVDNIETLYFEQPGLVELNFRRAEILAWIKGIEAENDRDPIALAAACGIRAFKKPIVSSR